MKKFISAIVAGAMMFGAVSPAFSATDTVYLKFKDGTGATYRNVPQTISNEEFAQAVLRDTGKNFFADVDHTQSKVVQETMASQIAQPEQQEAEEGSLLKTVGKILLVAAGVGLAVYAFNEIKSTSDRSNPCVLPSDRARDGSICGGRASSVRPGGR